MTKRFDDINLATLPAPEAVETISFEALLSFRVADLKVRWPAWDMGRLETDPLKIDQEVGASRETLIRARVNDGYKASTLAYAVETDLDLKGAEYSTARKIIDPGDAFATPPLPVIYESDDDYRLRIQLAFEALSTAGPAGAYIYHTLAADGAVLDAAVFGPESGLVGPGQVLVVVLSREDGGVPSGDLLNTVRAYLSADDRRPLTDQLIVQGADIAEYEIEAEITVGAGADAELVRGQAEDAVTAWAAANGRIGSGVTLGRIFAALYVRDDSGSSPVLDVTIASPEADIAADPTAAPVCSGVTVTVVVTP